MGDINNDDNDNGNQITNPLINSIDKSVSFICINKSFKIYKLIEKQVNMLLKSETTRFAIKIIKNIDSFPYEMLT